LARGLVIGSSGNLSIRVGNHVVTTPTGCSLASMQNHGSVAYGAGIAQACDPLELLEWLCELHLAAHQLCSPRVLDAAELADVARTLATESSTRA